MTVFGVMVVTFLLFRVMAGDVASANLSPKASATQKAEWHHQHGYDRPWFVNYHRQMLIIDNTEGPNPLRALSVKGSNVVLALGLFTPGQKDFPNLDKTALQHRLIGKYVPLLKGSTSIEELTAEEQLTTEDAPRPVLGLKLSDESELRVDLEGVKSFGELGRRIEQHPDNNGRVEVTTTQWHLSDLFNSQFVHHLVMSVTFQARSLADNKKLTTVVAERAPYSLALMIPALALGWILSLTIACFVAYFRGTLIDRAGVFLSVLGMCIPPLAFMIFGQWFMFEIAPRYAYGTYNLVNIYVPVIILAMAGLGARVRFYRTIILDETNRDYVRTARAKGLPLLSVLFKHILRNCMLPILTNLITMIPFLILGSILFENYFGIPGLGALMLNSITQRDEPILSALVFLIAAVYTLSVLITDLSYAVFDPRVRLR